MSNAKLRAIAKGTGACIDYILDSELEDFAENPSENHVYFHALVVAYGPKHAKEYLKQAISDLENGVNDLLTKGHL